MRFRITGAFDGENCLPTYNAYIDQSRYNKYSANNFKKRYMKIINTFIPVGHINGAFDINIVCSENNKRRDKDNVCSFALKLILDTLQERGTIQNDKMVENMGTKVIYNGPYIDVEITEVSK